METSTTEDRETFLRVSNDLEGYLDLCAKARAQNPKDRDTHVQHAAALGYLGRGDEKVALLDEWLQVWPNDLLANVNRGLELLKQGRYAEGWPNYHFRKYLKGTMTQPPQLGPDRQWNAQPLDGKTILLLKEQGMGDSIHFARFAADLRDRHRTRPILDVQEPLRALFNGSPALPRALVPHEPAEIHYWKPLGDLVPHVFPTLNDVTWPGAYIAPPALPDPPRLSGTRPLRVGLAWRGNPIHGHDSFRSTGLEQLAALQEASNCDFYALTPDAAAEIADTGGWVTDMTAQTRPFERLAHVIAHMDVVVSVCTSAAHLAAAMGKPVYLLLSYVADWRWGRVRETTPWYPSMRLFRQRKLADWQDVSERAAAHLQTL